MLRKKTRLRVLADISLEPHTVLKQAEEGTVVYREEGEEGPSLIEVKLDQHHEGLDLWNNEAHLTGPELKHVSLKDEWVLPEIYPFVCAKSFAVRVTLAALALVGVVEVAEAVERTLSLLL